MSVLSITLLKTFCLWEVILSNIESHSYYTKAFDKFWWKDLFELLWKLDILERYNNPEFILETTRLRTDRN